MVRNVFARESRALLGPVVHLFGTIVAVPSIRTVDSSGNLVAHLCWGGWRGVLAVQRKSHHGDDEEVTEKELRVLPFVSVVTFLRVWIRAVLTVVEILEEMIPTIPGTSIFRRAQ